MQRGGGRRWTTKRPSGSLGLPATTSPRREGVVTWVGTQESDILWWCGYVFVHVCMCEGVCLCVCVSVCFCGVWVCVSVCVGCVFVGV